LTHAIVSAIIPTSSSFPEPLKKYSDTGAADPVGGQRESAEFCTDLAEVAR